MTSTNGNNTKSSFNPYWNPWGPGGCLWRSILFLLGLLLIVFFMALLFRGCNNVNMDNPLDPGEKDLYEEERDTSLVKDWNDSIPDVKELPSPKDNYIPPVDSTSFIQNPEDSISVIICDQLIVFFDSKDLKKDMADFAQKFKQIYPDEAYKILYYNPTAGTMLLQVPKERLIDVANELPQKIPGIDFRVATNEILEEGAKPSDPGFAVGKYDEYFKLIQAYEAWDVTKGSKDVKVAIVDSYFDLTNPEINSRYSNQIHIPSKTANVLPPAQNPTKSNMDLYCHGSHVAGLAIGSQNNKLGCSGIAPECSWIPISLGNQLTTFNIMEGLLYAIYHGADVVNFSLGRMFPDNAKNIPIEQQIKTSTDTDKRGEALWEYIVKVANDHNCVLVTSAGNNTILMGMDPKNRSNALIKVEAVDGKGQMAEFSNYGLAPEAGLHYSTVAAPGVNLWSVSDKRCAPLWKKAGYVVSQKEGLQEMSGTSMASPVVAGAVALLKSKKKELTSEEVIKILVSTAKQTDTQHRIGPTIQIRDALNAVGGEKLNFDDLMKNHNLLIGKWKSTHELVIERDGKKIDDIWTYFIFTSTTAGVVEHHCLTLGDIYKANLTVKWSNNSLTIYQQGKAVSQNGSAMEKDDFICKPNQQRLLETTCRRNGRDQYNFLLEKIQ